MGFILILISSIKPSTKNNVQNNKYSKKNIFLKNEKLKITISKEKKIPSPAEIDTGDS